MDDLAKLTSFGDSFRGKNIVITGITGFKGSWLARWLQLLGANVRGFGLEPNTNPAHIELLQLGYDVIDIRDYDQVSNYIHKSKPDLIFHLAAQSLVREAYRSPIYTYETNLMGTLNLYHSCLNHNGLEGVISITSDKVYENKETSGNYRETDLLGGHDMYSSSKACVEVMTSSFCRSFKDEISFPIITARAGNVIGGGDWAEDRLIPDLYRSIESNNRLVLRYPNSIRPWQHVLEPLSGYLLIGQKILSNGIPNVYESWNFGPNEVSKFTVKELVEMACKRWEMPNMEVEILDNKPHEAGILMVDSGKAKDSLSWKPVWDTEEAVIKTVDWYRNFMNQNFINTDADIESYQREAEKRELVWATYAD